METVNEISGGQGELDGLETSEKGSLVGAINEVLTKANTNKTAIGTLSSLATSAKGDTVSAINEVRTTANNASSVANTATSNIGTLSSLTTTAKTNLVAAINEVDSNADSALSAIGTLSSLGTTAKGNTVAAINEVQTTANNAKNAVGTLSSLATTAKTSAVTAINEVLTKGNTNASDISALKTRCSAIEDVNTSQASSISGVIARTEGLTTHNRHNHNRIYRGKNLGVFNATHSANIRNGSNSEMYIGDYFTAPANAQDTLWGNNQWLIASCGYGVYNCLVLMPITSISPGQWNTTWTNEGGYAASNWRNNVKPQLEADAAKIFIDSSHLLKTLAQIPAAHDNGVYTGFVQVQDFCCELPSIPNLGYEHGNLSKLYSFEDFTWYEYEFDPFPLFSLHHWYAVMGGWDRVATRNVANTGRFWTSMGIPLYEGTNTELAKKCRPMILVY